jgi:hypothetical protein
VGEAGGAAKLVRPARRRLALFLLYLASQARDALVHVVQQLDLLPEGPGSSVSTFTTTSLMPSGAVQIVLVSEIFTCLLRG